MTQLTAARLRELLHYDPFTGVFTWLVRRGGKALKGSIAGTICDGYIAISVDGKPYKAHQLAWLYMTGAWPLDEIDHKDTIKTRNVWTNLRAATRAINMQNQRNIHAGKAGALPLGVFAHGRGKFQASIGIGGRSKHIGTFATPEEASTAYLVAKRQLHPGCTL